MHVGTSASGSRLVTSLRTLWGQQNSGPPGHGDGPHHIMVVRLQLKDVRWQSQPEAARTSSSELRWLPYSVGDSPSRRTLRAGFRPWLKPELHACRRPSPGTPQTP
eukprot:3156371-Rhodomonas_salina.2